MVNVWMLPHSSLVVRVLSGFPCSALRTALWVGESALLILSFPLRKMRNFARMKGRAHCQWVSGLIYARMLAIKWAKPLVLSNIPLHGKVSCSFSESATEPCLVSLVTCLHSFPCTFQCK